MNYLLIYLRANSYHVYSCDSWKNLPAIVTHRDYTSLPPPNLQFTARSYANGWIIYLNGKSGFTVRAADDSASEILDTSTYMSETLRLGEHEEKLT